ncbi:UNKNOWN [Stylonychia lemnae]|uniref:Uncharacterized protein n=1 Tax=Stylonychia lemnae TaxID=5949 RepID=A0A078BB35_STYLE|nr:UNKNOWN [Stylonychia lemnae]|eukprot:CDW90462.1 UNKNOWN [Stylonychia lemnae]
MEAQYIYSGIVQCKQCNTVITNFMYKFLSDQLFLKKKDIKYIFEEKQRSELNNLGDKLEMDQTGILKQILKKDKYLVFTKRNTNIQNLTDIDPVQNKKDKPRLIMQDLFVGKLFCFNCKIAIARQFLSKDDKKYLQIISHIILKKKKVKLIDQIEYNGQSKKQQEEALHQQQRLEQIKQKQGIQEATNVIIVEKLGNQMRKLKNELDYQNKDLIE